MTCARENHAAADLRDAAGAPKRKKALITHAIETGAVDVLEQIVTIVRGDRRTGLFTGRGQEAQRAIASTSRHRGRTPIV
jgi:hypothetical protein